MCQQSRSQAAKLLQVIIWIRSARCNNDVFRLERASIDRALPVLLMAILLAPLEACCWGIKLPEKHILLIIERRFDRRTDLNMSRFCLGKIAFGRQLVSYALATFLSLGLGWGAWGITTPEARAQEIPAIPSSSRNFVASAIDRVGPAVVRIDTERTVAASADPFANDPFFRRFFGEELPRQRREFQQRGQGSGFIIDGEGIVLTNAHVVSKADTVTVTLRDGREFEGTVLGYDEPTDLAVVKIPSRDLPIAPLGSSDDIAVGDWAIAVGNPLGLDNTVTLGIVSTLNRPSAKVGIPDKRIDFIQTDAAINPGNSGGPLLNERGEVIGINTAIRADGQGIGFAIPIDKVKEIKDRLVRGEQVPHPYIGIRMVALTPEMARQSNADPNSAILLPEAEGVLVLQVVPDSPAEAAGLRRGDVIVAVDGEAMASAEELQRLVEESRIGQPLSVDLVRGGNTLELTVRSANLDALSLE